MPAIHMADYGLTGPFAALAHSCPLGRQAARIISQEKGFYHIVCENGERLASVSGKLLHGAASALDLPAVGDFVWTDADDTSNPAVIHGILPRKSVFVRKAAGAACTEQVVAANIDTVFLCMALNSDFNLRRLERYLTIAWSSGATPVIVLTKSDLCADLPRQLRAVDAVAAGADVLVTSGLLPDGCRQLLPYLRPGTTAALMGSSGTGKSTLINRLLGEELLATNGLRGDGKGRHTTTRRQLLLLPCGGMVIDTPGMRELGLWDDGQGLNRSFADIDALTSQCRFRSCTHTGEPGCAVKAALADGTLSPERWSSFQKLRAENRYTEDNSAYMAEKRRKFKAIAKINRSSHRREEW